MPATLSFTAVPVPSGGGWRIVANGELDLRTGTELIRAAAELLADGALTVGATAVDLDLAGVTFVDTAGWRAVEDAGALLAAGGASSALVATSPAVRRLLDTLGIRATGR